MSVIKVVLDVEKEVSEKRIKEIDALIFDAKHRVSIQESLIEKLELEKQK